MRIYPVSIAHHNFWQYPCICAKKVRTAGETDSAHRVKEYWGKRCSASDKGLVFKAYLVCNKRDKLAVSGFSLANIYSIAEKAVEGIDIASVPSYLDSVANSPLNARRRSGEFLCNRRIQKLCDAFEHLAVINAGYYRLAQLVIPFDVRRNAYLVDNIRNDYFKVGAAFLMYRGAARTYVGVNVQHSLYPVAEHLNVKRL